MLCEVHTKTGHTITGTRNWWLARRETKGFHHFRITHWDEFPRLVGLVVAIELANIDYLVILDEKGW